MFIWDVLRDLAPRSEASVGNDEDVGVAPWIMRGFVVNRPFPASVATVSKLGNLGLLGNLTLFHGGLEGDGCLSVLHTWPDVDGSVPVNESETLFLGGDLSSLNTHLAEGGPDASTRIRVFMGYTQMPLVENPSAPTAQVAHSVTPPDLGLEDPDGFFFASGPGVHDLLFAQPLFDTDGFHRSGAGLGLHERVEGYNHARFWRECITSTCFHRAGPLLSLL